ncbi:MAG: biotin/lipoyl-binding protein, partial [Pseudomonadota bacterium]
MSTGQTDEPAALNRDRAELVTDCTTSEQAQAGRGVHADVSAAAKPRRGFLRRIVSTSAALGVAGLFVGAMISGITVLKTRADIAAEVQANPVIRVNTQAFRIQENYAIGQSFVGRIEPTRQTQLAFERAGIVLEVMVEEGAAVKAGQTIARLGTAGLKTRQQELQAQRAETQARLSLAKQEVTASLRESRSGLIHAPDYEKLGF